MAAKFKLPSIAPKKPLTTDGQMELMEHLAELRMRLFRIILYVAVGMIITYNQFGPIMAILTKPLAPIIDAMHGQIIQKNITDGFILYMQVCFISGLLVAFPFVVGELWGFIAPALTEEERRPVKFLAPFSALLFLAGVGTAYAALPATYTWMAGFIASVPGSTLMQTAQEYVILTLKILLSFGIAFELPIVLLFLARIGIINAELMTKYWRHAVVVIAGLAAVLTPSNDPLTMLMMAVPMAGLYLLSISLVKAFAPKADGSRSMSFGAMLAVGLAPVAILLAVGFWLWRTSTTEHPATDLAPTASTTGAMPAPKSVTPGTNTAPAPGASPAAGATPAPDASPAPSTQEIEELRTQVRELNERLQRLESAQPAPEATPVGPPPGSDPYQQTAPQDTAPQGQAAPESQPTP